MPASTGGIASGGLGPRPPPDHGWHSTPRAAAMTPRWPIYTTRTSALGRAFTLVGNSNDDTLQGHQPHHDPQVVN